MWPLTNRGPAAGLHAYKIHISVDGPVELILIVGPQGERLHLHP